MIDNFNNDTGLPPGDDKPDDQATWSAKVKYDEYVAQQNAQARAVVMGTDPTQVSASSLSPDVGTLGAQVAGLDAVYGKTKDDSFPVRLTGGRQTFTVPQFIAKSGRETSQTVDGITTPINTLLKGGFLEVTYQPVIDKVAALSGNKKELADTIYTAAVNRAAFLQKTGTNTSVEKVLEQWEKGGLPDELKRLVDGSGGSGGPFSVTNRVVSLTDAGTARQVVNQALTRYLGREATVSENRAFLQALNVQEKQNPTITTTKGVTSGRNTDQNQTVTGGFDRNDFAERFARSQQGYAEYQTATTYLDAFINALESDSRVI